MSLLLIWSSTTSAITGARNSSPGHHVPNLKTTLDVGNSELRPRIEIEIVEGAAGTNPGCPGNVSLDGGGGNDKLLPDGLYVKDFGVEFVGEEKDVGCLVCTCKGEASSCADPITQIWYNRSDFSPKCVINWWSLKLIGTADNIFRVNAFSFINVERIKFFSVR